MKFLHFAQDGQAGLAIADGLGFKGLMSSHADFPGTLQSLVAAGHEPLAQAARLLRAGETIDLQKISYLPPFENPGKIFCIGLNYVDHSVESGFEVPAYPAIFSRFN